jgi:predicted component of type VI protein secretion system
MGVFRSIEHRIESLVEGAFGRAFRSHVQPVELARKLAKEMDEHKTISVSRVYVPNEYVVYLSPQDRETLPPADALVTELSDYLADHARREGYALLSTPRVLIEEDEDLAIGEFGIATRMVQRQRETPGAAPAAPSATAPPVPPVPAPDVVPAPAMGATKVFQPPVPDTAAVSAGDAERLGLAREPAALVVAGTRHELSGRTAVLGRSHECDVTLDDPNVSRRHAEIRHEDGAYWIVDLGSTNGVEVNGQKTDRARLSNQDRIVLGQTDILFESPV